MKKILVIIVVFLLLGCSQDKGKIELAIIKKSENCATSECIFKLNDLTPFTWEKVYFFEVPVNKEFIDKTLNTEYNNYIEFTTPIVFLNDGKVVYSENRKSSIEKISSYDIIIGDISDTLKVKMFTPDKAIFKSTLKQNGDVKYYELKEIR